MTIQRAANRSIAAIRLFFLAAILATSPCLAQAQNPQALIQQMVDTERAANAHDHSQWTFLQRFNTPKDRSVQWVAETKDGNVQRVLEKNGSHLSEADQRDGIQRFLHDIHAQKKEVAEREHDNQQVDDFLKLLPVAFLWTETGKNETTTFLRFEPAPNFQPPTREARVFAAMSGNVTIDNEQHRVRNMSGYLTRDVTFGGGLLGRLKQGSSFSLSQEQAAPLLWQLSAIHVHLAGNALLFKSISLQQDDERSRFTIESPAITLDQAATSVMQLPNVVAQK